jgi:HlyB family type I secretion system ABC transporter
VNRRIPVIHQMSALECGAACLSMILTYHGRKTRVSECRGELDVGRDGLTALTIAKAARLHGLRVRAYSLNLRDLKFVQLPAIVHWNFNHFVVLEKWTSGKVVVIDPAVGRLTLNAEEFDAGFTGVVLMFEPGVHFERTSRPEPSLWRRYFLKYVLKSPALLLQIIGATLLLQGLGLVFPIFTKLLVDYVLPFQVRGVLTICGLGMVLLVIAQMVTSYTRGALLLFIQARLDSQMMLDFFEHLLSLPFKFFQQRSSGDLLMRLSSNAVIRELLTSQTMSLVLDGSLVVIYLLILITQATSFGLIVLAIGLLQVSLLLATTRKVQALMQSDLSAQAKSQSYLVEALTRIEAIKSAGAEERTLDHWSNLFFNQINISLKRGHLSILIDSGMMTLRLLSPLILVWFGAYRVLDGSMSLGSMLAFNALAAAFLSPLSSLVSNGQRLQLVSSHLERVADVLQAEPEQLHNGDYEIPALSGRVEVNNVSFRYDANAPEVLKNISLRIESGQKVAIVGRTGSGKSTLGKLLLGLYTPTEGSITYDEVPLELMNCRALRSQFGVVLQDSLLFSGSVRQNIAFNDSRLSLEQVKDSARLAVIHDEIEAMPMGYETLVSEGNGGLAGGQRQRLSLARALAHKPVILLLDEATSHLDAITERRVDQNLSSLSSTRIVIAHRLSTIVNADLILVLEQGRIVERGTHRTLLAQNGLYAELINSQAESDEMQAVA